jgi:hypothetical protein
VSLPFDRSEWFSFDKPADVPCRHLQPSHGCGIHERLAERGHAGCAHYDCYGAGQRVTRELLQGRSWRSSPELARAAFAAFRQLKHIHELRLLLHEASALELGAEQAQRRDRLLAQLEPEPDFDAERLAWLDVAALEEQVYKLLRELSGHVASRHRLRLLP